MRNNNVGKNGGPQQLLKEQLVEMDNFDKDKRFMAAGDIVQIVLKAPSHSIDQAMQSSIFDAYLKQLEDPSVEIQGNAIKCIAEITAVFLLESQGSQITSVLQRLASSILLGRAELRDVYSTCLKGLILKAHLSAGALFCHGIVPTLVDGLASDVSQAGVGGQQLDLSIQEECCDVLTEMLKRFGDDGVWPQHQDRICDSLLAIIQLPSSRPTLHKRAIAALGVLAVWLPPAKFSNLCNILLHRAGAASPSTTTTTSPKPILTESIESHRRQHIIGLSHTTRQVGARMRPFVAAAAPCFLDIVRSTTVARAVGEGDDDDGESGSAAEVDHELAESAIAALEHLVGTCATEMSPFIGALVELTLQLLSYDPNYYGSTSGSDSAAWDVLTTTDPGNQDQKMDDDDGDEFEDEDDDDFGYEDAGFDDGVNTLDEDNDDGDTSWKVRRGALKLVSALVRSSELPGIDSIYSAFTVPVVTRCLEREETVRLEVLDTLTNLLNSCLLPSARSVAFIRRGSLVNAMASVPGGLSEGGGELNSRVRREAVSVISEAPKILGALRRLLRTSSSQKVHRHALDVLSAAAVVMPANVELSLDAFVGNLKKLLSDSDSSILIATLNFIYLLCVYSQSPTTYNVHAEELLSPIMTLCQAVYTKTASQALRTAEAYITAMRLNVTSENDSTEIRESKERNLRLVEKTIALMTQLMSTKKSETEAETAVKAVGHLCAQLGEIASLHAVLGVSISEIADRLRLDSTRTNALRALSQLLDGASNADLMKIADARCVTNMVTHLTDIMAQPPRQLKQKATELLTILTSQYAADSSKSPEPLQLSLVMKAVAAELAADEGHHHCQPQLKLLSALLLSAASTPPSTKNELVKLAWQGCLPKVVQISKNPQTEAATFEVCLAVLRGVAAMPDSFDLPRLAAELDATSIERALAAHWDKETGKSLGSAYKVAIRRLALCLGALSADPDVRQRLLDASLQTLASVPKMDGAQGVQGLQLREQLAVLTVGAIGRTANLAESGKSIFQEIDRILSVTSNEDLKAAAAHALGAVTVGSLAVYLPLLVTKLQAATTDASAPNAQRTRHLLLTSLREVISDSHRLASSPSSTATSQQAAGLRTETTTRPDPLHQYLAQIVPLLEASSSSQDSNDRLLVSDSFGQLLLADSSSMIPPLNRLLLSPDIKQKATAVIAIRNAILWEVSGDSLLPLGAPFLHCLSSDVPYSGEAGLRDILMLRRVCWQTLSAAAAQVQNHLLALTPDIPTIEPLAARDSTVEANHVRVMDLGPFKDRVDDGEPVRRAVTSALTGLVRHAAHLVNVENTIQIVCKGLRDTPDVQQLSCSLLIEVTQRASDFRPALPLLDQLWQAADAALQAEVDLRAKSKGDDPGSSDQAAVLMRAVFAVVRRAMIETSPQVSGQMLLDPAMLMPTLKASPVAEISGQLVTGLGRRLESDRHRAAWRDAAARLADGPHE